MSGHKTTHTQLERFRLIDSMLSDGEVIPFEKILDSLRLELHDDLLSDSSLRRDFRYMKNELVHRLLMIKSGTAGIIPSLLNCRQKALVMMKFFIWN